MPIISVIAANHASSMGFILQLAKLNQLLDRESILVDKSLFSDFLYQYPYDLIHISDVILADEVDTIKPKNYYFYLGYKDFADHYLLILEHNLFNIRYLSSQLAGKEIDNLKVILLDSLSVQANIDYICGFYFKDYNVPLGSRFTIALDEIDQEELFLAQIDGKINLKNLSKERRNILLTLAENILGFDQIELKKASKLVKKRGLL